MFVSERTMASAWLTSTAAVVCTGLRVLAASIRQCRSVESWCHTSSQFIKWIFSQPLLQSACGQAVVAFEFYC